MKTLLIACAFGLISFRIHVLAQEVVFKATADLNNDGRAEKIVLKGIEDSYDFSLTISGI